MSVDVLSCLARPVFLLLIYADCDGNTASFPFPGKIGRTFCATISSTLPWPRIGTATTKAPITIAKIFVRFYRAIFYCSALLCNAVAAQCQAMLT